MTADNNKDVVRRFIEEVLASGKLDQIDELVAPAYVNRALGGGVEAFKQMLAGMSAALPDRRFVDRGPGRRGRRRRSPDHRRDARWEREDDFLPGPDLLPPRRRQDRRRRSAIHARSLPGTRRPPGLAARLTRAGDLAAPARQRQTRVARRHPPPRAPPPGGQDGHHAIHCILGQATLTRGPQSGASQAGCSACLAPGTRLRNQEAAASSPDADREPGPAHHPCSRT